MTSTKTKPHLERLIEQRDQERLLLASGAIYQTIFEQTEPISDVAIAMELDMSVSQVRSAIAELFKDELVESNFQGDWSVAF